MQNSQRADIQSRRDCECITYTTSSKTNRQKVKDAKQTFKVIAAHGRPAASFANWMPTALLLARPEYLNELTLVRLLGSDVSTTLPDLQRHAQHMSSRKHRKDGKVGGGVGLLSITNTKIKHFE